LVEPAELHNKLVDRVDAPNKVSSSLIMQFSAEVGSWLKGGGEESVVFSRAK